jgi:hypothetical protein
LEALREVVRKCKESKDSGTFWIFPLCMHVSLWGSTFCSRSLTLFALSAVDADADDDDLGVEVDPACAEELQQMRSARKLDKKTRRKEDFRQKKIAKRKAEREAKEAAEATA